MEMKFGTREKIVVIPSVTGAALIFLGILSNDIGVLGNMIVISTFVIVVPYFLYRYSRFMWIKSIEGEFPNFVRDMADSIRSGMSFADAVGISSKANYGKLTPEVVKMNNRLSWGTPFMRVMEIFSGSVKESKIINEAVDIIKQSYESGGNISSTLDSVASDIMMLKEAEAERSSLVRQHIMIMYGIFFMFLGISIMIIFVMVPMLQSQSGQFASTSARGVGFTFKNPCDVMSAFPCGLFGGICSMLGVGAGIGCFYIAMFFTVVVIQGFFIGLITGQLGENSVIAGTKHSLIMVIAAISIFIFLAKSGILSF